ncbi:hypothetical protein HZC32_03470 [Candidatus Woesearchaeota archaeon]|nr:hypothetical protein [Candidatus Woesearchaeota archaeon]
MKNDERVVLKTVRRYKTASNLEIRRRTGLGRDAINYVLRKHELYDRSHRNCVSVPIVLDGPYQERQGQCGGYTKEQRNVVLEFILAQDPITIHQLKEGTGLEKEILLSILKDEQLVYLVPTQKRNPAMDLRITAGDTLEEIGAAGKVTNERVRQYVNATGQHDYWMEQRKRRKAEKREKKENLCQVRQDLTNVLISRAYQKAEEGGWKYRRKALDYYYNGVKEKKYKTKDVSTPLEKLFTLFEVYEMAEHLNVKLSLKEMEERTGIWFPLISRILKSKGLEPFYGARERISPLSLEKSQAVERVYGLEFTPHDVAYFLGLSKNPWVVGQHFVEIRRKGAVKIKRKKCLFQKGRQFGSGAQKSDYLFYRTASQIYELDDLAQEEKISFSEGEVGRLLEIGSECVDYARKNRGWIESDIKKLLKIIYSGKEWEKPYL